MTDTATLVLYDQSELVEKLQEECDWWTGSGDLEAEEAAMRIAFVATGADGPYALTVTDETVGEHVEEVKQGTIRIGAGPVLIGAGEYLPGEGMVWEHKLPSVPIHAGEHEYRIYSTQAKEPGCIREYIIVFDPAAFG